MEYDTFSNSPRRVYIRPRTKLVSRNSSTHVYCQDQPFDIFLTISIPKLFHFFFLTTSRGVEWRSLAFVDANLHLLMSALVFLVCSRFCCQATVSSESWMKWRNVKKCIRNFRVFGQTFDRSQNVFNIFHQMDGLFLVLFNRSRCL